jgi:hypothetical protein
LEGREGVELNANAKHKTNREKRTSIHKFRDGWMEWIISIVGLQICDADILILIIR